MKISASKFLIALLFVTSIFAEKLDLETHNSLITKLESLVKDTDPDGMIKNQQLVLRLADLYSERARLLGLQNEGKGEEQNKNQISADRKKAIMLYLSVEDKIKEKDKDRALLQLAHLYQLNQENSKSVAIYKKIISDNSKSSKKTHSNETLGLAHLHWGDILFFEGDFKKSLDHFESSIKIPNFSRKNYALYRSAWCHFNLGHNELAKQQLKSLLKNPQNEESLKIDVSHDLASIIAKKDSDEVNLTEIKEFIALSPNSVKLKNLIFLASEFNRTGKKNNSLLVWKFIGKQKLSLDEKIEGQIQMVRIQYDLGHKKETFEEVKASAFLLLNCTPSSPKVDPNVDPNTDSNVDCEVHRQNLKKILKEWGKAEEKKPSDELISSFAFYADSFSDLEMTQWTAQFYYGKKQFPLAASYFQKAVLLVNTLLSNESANGRHEENPTNNDTKELLSKKEKSLRGILECAEYSSNKDVKLNLYQFYIDQISNASEIYKIKYQMATIYYEKSDFLRSANEFRKLATVEKFKVSSTESNTESNTKFNTDSKDSSPNSKLTKLNSLREKSAELCLDSLALLKNNEQIEIDSLNFAKIYPEKSQHFMSIWKKSVFKTLNTSIASRHLDEIKKSAEKLITSSNLDTEESNFAHLVLAWYYESQLQFDKSLFYYLRIKPRKSEMGAYIFKLALLKELNNENPTDEYKSVLKLSNNKDKVHFSLFQLISHSEHPDRLFLKSKNKLKTNDYLYVLAGVKSFEKTNNQSVLSSLTKMKNLKKYQEGQVLLRSLSYKNFFKTYEQFSSLKIATKNLNSINKKLSLKLKLLKDLEKQTQSFITAKDNSLQIVSLSYLSMANKDIVDTIQSVPLPARLTKAEKPIYISQVEKMILPYKEKQQQTLDQMTRLWKIAEKLQLFKSLYDLSQEPQRAGSALALKEINYLKSSLKIHSIENDPFINFSQERFNLAKEVEKLKVQIAENPFNNNNLERLKKIKKDLGDGILVANIESRLSLSK